jgi:gluconate 5-dehydrogenase
VNTPLWLEVQEAEPELAEVVRQKNPMQRFAEAEEIAAAALWLVSDASSYVNGHPLIIDGGHASAA